MVTGLFAEDGCVAPNIRTQDYKLTFTAKCEHGKVRSAEIVISAPTADDALEYVRNLQQGVMKNTILTGAELVHELVHEHECPEGTWHTRNNGGLFAIHPDNSTHRI